MTQVTGKGKRAGKHCKGEIPSLSRFLSIQKSSGSEGLALQRAHPCGAQYRRAWHSLDQLSPGWGARALHTPTPAALAHSPQDIVHTHDALGLQVARVVDDRPLGLQPHIAPVLGKHSVLAAHHLALGAH